MDRFESKVGYSICALSLRPQEFSRVHDHTLKSIILAGQLLGA